jgi:hypothetical protein
MIKQTKVAALCALLISTAYAIQEPQWTLLDFDKDYWFYDAANIKRSPGGTIAVWVEQFELNSFMELMRKDPRAKRLDTATDTAEFMRLARPIAESVVKDARRPAQVYRFEFDCQEDKYRILDNPTDKTNLHYPSPWSSVVPGSIAAGIEAPACK